MTREVGMQARGGLGWDVNEPCFRGGALVRLAQHIWGFGSGFGKLREVAGN